MVDLVVMSNAHKTWKRRDVESKISVTLRIASVSENASKVHRTAASCCRDADRSNGSTDWIVPDVMCHTLF